MRTSLVRSALHFAAWMYVGPFVVIVILALFVLGFSVLAVAMQLMATLLKHAAI